MKIINENGREGRGENIKHVPYKNFSELSVHSTASQGQIKNQIGCNVCVFYLGVVRAILLFLCKKKSITHTHPHVK